MYIQHIRHGNYNILCLEELHLYSISLSHIQWDWILWYCTMRMIVVQIIFTFDLSAQHGNVVSHTLASVPFPPQPLRTAADALQRFGPADPPYPSSSPRPPPNSTAMFGEPLPNNLTPEMSQVLDTVHQSLPIGCCVCVCVCVNCREIVFSVKGLVVGALKPCGGGGVQTT